MTPSTVVADLSQSEGRCAWTGNRAEHLEPIEVPCVNRWGKPAGRRTFWVEPRHREEFIAHANFVVRHARWFVPTMVTALGVMMIGAQAAGFRGLGAGLAMLGLLYITLPCATPETVWMMGVRKSVLMVRGIGIVLLIVAVIFIATPPVAFP